MAQRAPTPGNDSRSATLASRRAELQPLLSRNAYGRPLFLESTETSDQVSGHAYAVLDSPFEAVSSAFKTPGRWCEVMILHLNTKYCRASTDSSPAMLQVKVGKKTPQETSDAYGLDFAFKLAAATPEYLAVQLNADKGPVGTTQYRIELEAVALPEGKTFMHLRYSYGYGMAGRIAMQSYLATMGRAKVGFTQLEGDKKPALVGGMRGAIERNTMRYYLAIEAYLAARGKPPAEQAEARFEYWFDATERYPLQLREIDKASYLSMKKAEYQRQLSGAPS